MGFKRIRIFDQVIANTLPDMEQVKRHLEDGAKEVAAHVRRSGTSHVTGHVHVDGTTVRNSYAGALSIEFGTATNPPFADHRRAVQAVTGRRMEDR